jgi:hypothetical protein
VIDLGRGRYAEAAASYEPLLLSLGPLMLWPQVAGALEAFIRAGLDAEVEALVARFTGQAHESGIAWALARAEHLRGLSAGDDSYSSCFTHALRWHAQAAQPFRSANTSGVRGATAPTRTPGRRTRPPARRARDVSGARRGALGRTSSTRAARNRRARRASPCRSRPEPDLSGAPGGARGCAGRDEPGGGGAAVSQSQDDREAPRLRLHKARRRLAKRTRTRVRARTRALEPVGARSE